MRHAFFLLKKSNLLYISKRLKSKENFFRIVEVSARDGLQNETTIVKTEDKINLINRLSECGFKSIEATSFVSPKWIPQMADHEKVFDGIKKYSNVSYPVLVPNKTGLDKALTHNVSEIAVFTAASESFTRKNTNCSLKESLDRAKNVTKLALKNGLKVRGYISTVIGCPYEGYISPVIVAQIAEQLLDFGCYEISLGDTIGIGTVGTVEKLLNEVFANVSKKYIAVHFHDTYGQALSNVFLSIEKGITVVDSSVAGLGGCPYAKGATGNLATEDLVYMLHGLGFNTGIDFEKLINVSNWICTKMKRPNASKTTVAVLGKQTNIK